MHRWFIDLLECPRCRQGLQRSDDGLVCPEGHPWSAKGGIPRFVADQGDASSFGFQWQRFPRTQFDDEQRDESRRTLEAKTGLDPSQVEGRLVLDVGCGSGRFTEVLSSWGARVVGVDVSDAILAAHTNLSARENVAFAQASVFDLPFRSEAFDLVISIGVLHHTPDTRGAFGALRRLVRPGGTVAIWVYSRGLMWSCVGSELLRPITRRMDSERLLRWITRAEPVLHRLHRTPVLGRPARMLLPASEHPDATWRVLDTFDWWSPRFQWKHTEEEVESWFRSDGYSDVRALPAPVSVRGTAR